MDRTYKLFRGVPTDGYNYDPFVALADFSNILNACIFYDRVVFIDNGQLADDINNAMNLDEVFVPLSLGHDRWSPLARTLNSHYQWALHYFDYSTWKNAGWLTWLEEFWRHLLPGINFPEHSVTNFESRLSYNASPMRESWIDVICRVPQSLDAWVVGNRTADDWIDGKIRPLDTKKIILDNDIRALAYDRLAQTLDAMVGKESGFFTRYVGRCLRSPLQLARAKDADVRLTSSPPLEKWLLDEWVSKYPANQKLDQAVRLPFWAGAIFARCRGDAHALPEEIAKCRRQATKFQQRRAVLGISPL